MPCLPGKPARLLVLVLCAAAVAPAASAMPSATAVIASLNQMRLQNGIPGGIVENAAWSQKCALHNTYERENDTLEHAEDPRRPGYSTAGSWAGENSVLALGGTPIGVFTRAPFHLVQLLSPELREVGIAMTGSYTCITTWPGYDLNRYRGTRERVYTYPGNRTAGVSPQLTANEIPFTPGRFFGLPVGSPTGPAMFAYAVGPWDPWTVSVVAVTLTGPRGAVAMKSMDRLTKGIGEYLPPGAALLMPVVPLSPQARYTATIRLRNSAGRTVTHTWSFTTSS